MSEKGKKEIKESAKQKMSERNKDRQEQFRQINYQFLGQEIGSHFGTNSGLNPCPSLNSHRPYPLRRRRVLFLSTAHSTSAKGWLMAHWSVCV